MKFHAALWIAIAASSIAGCASVSTPMKHADGRVIDCSAAGFGLIGAPAALIMRDNCVSNARANGFVPLDEGGTSPATGITKATATYLGKATISLPEGWTRTTPPAVYTSVIDFAKNATYESFLLLSYIDKKQITDVSAYAETKKTAQISKLSEATFTETTKTDVKGRTAYVSDITGVLPSTGTKFHFRNTIIDDGGEILMLSVWETAANYDGKVKDHLDGIVDGLSGL